MSAIGGPCSPHRHTGWRGPTASQATAPRGWACSRSSRLIRRPVCGAGPSGCPALSSQAAEQLPQRPSPGAVPGTAEPRYLWAEEPPGRLGVWGAHRSPGGPPKHRLRPPPGCAPRVGPETEHVSELPGRGSKAKRLAPPELALGGIRAETGGTPSAHKAAAAPAGVESSRGRPRGQDCPARSPARLIRTRRGQDRGLVPRQHLSPTGGEAGTMRAYPTGSGGRGALP